MQTGTRPHTGARVQTSARPQTRARARGIDARLARVASRRHGLITLADVRDAGGDRNLAHRRVARGLWVRLHPGVYRVAAAPETPVGRLCAAVLAGGPGAVASHRSAAWLWGLTEAPPPLEVTVPRGRRYRPRGVVTHESTDLHLAAPTVIAGVPVTGLTRTLVDLGAVTGRAAVTDALDAARRLHGTGWEDLWHTVTIHSRRGRPGVGTARRILTDLGGELALTGSRFERLVERLLVASGLTPPVLQHPVRVGWRRYLLDLAWPPERVAVELDGAHHRSERAFQGDRVRQNRLELAGWTILRYTWRQYRDEPHRLVSEVAAALDAARSGTRAS